MGRKSKLSTGFDGLGLPLKHHFEYLNGRTNLHVIYQHGRRTIVLNEDLDDLLRFIEKEHSQFYDEDISNKDELISQEKIMSLLPKANTHVKPNKEESSSGNETLQPPLMQEPEPVPQYSWTTYPFGPQPLHQMNQNRKSPTKIMSSLMFKQKLE